MPQEGGQCNVNIPHNFKLMNVYALCKVKSTVLFIIFHKMLHNSRLCQTFKHTKMNNMHDDVNNNKFHFRENFRISFNKIKKKQNYLFDSLFLLNEEENVKKVYRIVKNPNVCFCFLCVGFFFVVVGHLHKI